MDGWDDEVNVHNVDFNDEVQNPLPGQMNVDPEVQNHPVGNNVNEEIQHPDGGAHFDDQIQNALPDADFEAEIQNAISDDEVLENSDDDFDFEIANAGRMLAEVLPTFSFNVEGTGLDRRLRTEVNGMKFAWEEFLLVVAQTLYYKECYQSMLTSFRRINASFSNARMPEDMRQFWRIVNRREANFTRCVVCTICWRNLGPGKVPLVNCNCNPVQCGPGLSNIHLGTFFYISLRSQLQQLLNKVGIAVDLQYPYTRQKRNENAIEDVYDGTEYRRHSEHEGGFLHRHRHNYSLAMWVDGVSPIKSANVHIVPVFFQVLELSPRARQRNSILAALYVGPRKASMSHYLAPVMEELQNLYIDGIIWNPEPDTVWTSRFMLLILSADSEERYTILGMTRHNGECGCTFCLVIGAGNQGAPNLTRVYPLENEIGVQDRTDLQIRENAVDAAELGVSINGVKGRSPLQSLVYVDLRVAQFLENLHCFWKNNFLRFYNNCTNSARLHHLTDRNVKSISDRILTIRAPTKLSRQPRSLTNVAKFTATELRNTCWFYWLPCAEEFLSPDQLRMSHLFAEATFILDKDSILQEELDRAMELLTEYRQLFQRTFPAEELVFNLHLLRHAVRCVRELGPTFVASGFWYESLNRQVVNYLTSPNDRASQVACRMLLWQMIDRYLDRPMEGESLLELRRLIGKQRWDVRPDEAVGAFVLFEDPGTPDQLDLVQSIAMRAAGININRGYPIRKHQKLVIDGLMYQVDSGTTKYNNAIAHINNVPDMANVNFIEITSMISWADGGHNNQAIFGTPFRTIRLAYETTYMHEVEKLYDQTIVIPVTDIIILGVLVEIDGHMYISRLSNRWNND